MSSVIDITTCDQCGYEEASLLYYTGSAEVTISCEQCGFHYKDIALTDRKKTAEKNDGVRYFLLNKEGKILHRVYKRKGYGCFYLTMKDGRGCYGGFYRPIDESDIEYFRGQMQQPDIDQSRSYVTSWNDDTKELTVLLGNYPIPRDEYEDSFFVGHEHGQP